jgi:hypothetical protein
MVETGEAKAVLEYDGEICLMGHAFKLSYL